MVSGTFQLFLTLFLTSSLSVFVHGHGMMCTPRQRGAYQASRCPTDLSEPIANEIDYCPHCLNAGGVGTVRNNLPPQGWTVYDPINDFSGFGNRAGLCGDPTGSTDHLIGGRFANYSPVPIVQTWKKNTAVDLMVEIDTNHNGYFEFFLCDLDKCNSRDISRKCFKNNACWRLHRKTHPDCEKHHVKTQYKCGPVDEDYPSRFYIPCRTEGKQYVGGKDGTMRYHLPRGVTCKHCVLQWYYVTANNCAAKGFLDYFEKYDNPFGTSCASDGGGLGAHRKEMNECGPNDVPEEFWSCADVRIVK